MLPNFRLMIAAMFASVVALVCGFAVFAALRVSHEPLVRVSPATAPLQLAAVNAATPPTNTVEPFAQRFQFADSASNEGISALAYSATQPNEQPVMKSLRPAAEEDDASEQASSPADSADRPTPAQQAPAAAAVLAAKPDEAAHEMKADEAPHETKPDDAVSETKAGLVEAADAQAAASAASVATIEPASTEEPASIEPSTEQAPPTEQTTEVETAPATAAAASVQAAPETATKVAERKKTAARTRVTAKAPRARKVRAAAFSSTQTNKQKSTFADTMFQIGAPWPETEQRLARSQRATITSRTSAESNSAIGGPFVSAPSR